MLQVLLKVPEDTIFNELPNNLQDVLSDLKAQVTGDFCFNTRSYYKYKLVNMTFNNDKMELNILELIIDAYDLKWKVLGANDGYITDVEGNRIINTIMHCEKQEVLEFVKRKVSTDDGVRTVSAPTEIKVGRFAGMLPFE